MRNFFIICITALLFSGCALTSIPAVREEYRGNIKQWQQIIKEEGWSHSLAEEVVSTTLSLCRYDGSDTYRWATPTTFLRQEMTGDCLEFAAQLLATFTFLEFPYGKRCRIVWPPYQPGYHAVFRYEWPREVWHHVEVTPTLTTWFEKYLFVTVIEFDDKRVY